MAPKKKMLEKPPKEEIYDYNRTIGPQTSDPRCNGPPCHGQHEAEAMGPGSHSGRNKFAEWTACRHCHLRLTYTPAFGCHGLSRKAGPLATDVEAQIKIHSPQKGSELLKDRTVGLEAAERSLQQRLEVIQAQKKSYQEVQDRKNQSKVKDLQGYPGVQTSKAPTALPSVKNEMAETPGRKARRPEETAEHLEYQNRAQVISDEEEEAWSKVSSPSKP